MLEIKDGKFLLNGKEFRIYSGCIHYFRVPEALWRDRLAKLKAAGLNTVETYVAWNMHEAKRGEYVFSGMADIVKFIKTAQELGLYVILRPGPYICAEWDLGGLPGWMLADKNVVLRCMNKPYLSYVEEWFKVLFDKVRDLQITRGGNIIAMQIENEYGSYGNDKEYLQYIADLMKKFGAEVLLFTADGNWSNFISGGGLPGVYKALTFGSNAAGAFSALKGLQDENMPKTCMEFWDGWFDHWGEKHHVRPPKQVEKEIKDFLDTGANFNLYMFHGGTNFGFTAGANHFGDYQPTTTSYDYNAPLSEWGDYTPLYRVLRALMLKERGLSESDLPLPPAPRYVDIGTVALTEFASLKGNLDNIGEKHRCGNPASMEDLGQQSGYMYYSTKMQGKYAMQPLSVNGIHDLAYISVNGGAPKRVYRNKKGLFGKKDVASCKFLQNAGEKLTLDIFVDCMGRVNYGSRIYDRKGIESVTYGNQHLFGWDIWTLPMDNLQKLAYDGEKKVPCFMRGTFDAKEKGECFIHLKGFVKGFVTVNGFNLGRYWNIGPQRALWLPSCLLKDKDNEIIVFEQEGYSSPQVELTSRPDLG